MSEISTSQIQKSQITNQNTVVTHCIRTTLLNIVLILLNASNKLSSITKIILLVLRQSSRFIFQDFSKDILDTIARNVQKCILLLFHLI